MGGSLAGSARGCSVPSSPPTSRACVWPAPSQCMIARSKHSKTQHCKHSYLQLEAISEHGGLTQTSQTVAYAHCSTINPKGKFKAPAIRQKPVMIYIYTLHLHA